MDTSSMVEGHCGTGLRGAADEKQLQSDGVGALHVGLLSVLRVSEHGPIRCPSMPLGSQSF